MRKIPATMATQHPDNAEAPYWDAAGDPFIGIFKEAKEAVRCFQDLGVTEFMWDWEGKHADAAVIDKLFTDYHDYFSKNQLGHHKFLTFRLPNIWEEKGYSLLQAMTVILSAEDFARDLKFSHRPLFEVILPMTERADQLMHMHALFQKLATFKSGQFSPDNPANNEYLELVPLVESVESQQRIGDLLREYVQLHKRHFGRGPAYIRPFMARSDPALMSGMLATVLANKLALSQVYEFSQKKNIPVYPISGVGSLPFRGGLGTDTIDDYIKEYAGMRTVSLQSSFRYDHSIAHVKAAVSKLERELPKSKPRLIAPAQQEQLKRIIQTSSKLYQTTLKGIVPDMQPVFAATPKRRERRQHIGLLAYGRSMGSQRLPRAITFTAAFYSIGIPPEFIGFGRTLRQLKPADLALLDTVYPSMFSDLKRAGRFYNTENLAILARRNHAWRQVQDDITAAQEVLGTHLGPYTHNEKAHKNLTSNALLLKNNHEALSHLIAETGRLRKSLG